MIDLTTDRLGMLYRISQTLNSTLALSEVLDLVMDEVIQATYAERAFVVLRETDGALDFRAARGLDQHTIEAPEFEVSRSIVNQVTSDGVPRLTSDAQADAWLSGQTSVSLLGLRSVLCVPLQVKDRVIGALYVDNRMHSGMFAHDDLELLSAIAVSAAIALENARLYEVAVEKGRMERELQVAREVQSYFVQHPPLALAGWEMAAAWQPAREVSGDFYDFIQTAPDRMAVVIADVSDKGMPAALFMALTRTVMRASTLPETPPQQIIAQANRVICADAPNGMFVSLCQLLINPEGGVVYVNAGHNPPLHYSARQETLTPLNRTGMVLGIDPDTPYEQHSLVVETDDLIVMYTDGVTEAMDEHGEQFGLERLHEVILSVHDQPPRQIIQALQQALAEFAGAALPHDDVTIVILRRI